jgi:hypothetical protein
VVALISQHDEPGGGQLADDPSDPGGPQVMGGAAQRPRTPDLLNAMNPQPFPDQAKCCLTSQNASSR